MEINYVTATYKLSKSLGNYESLSAEVTLQARVDPDEDGEDCLAFLQSRAKSRVHEFIVEAAAEAGAATPPNIKKVHKVSGMEVI